MKSNREGVTISNLDQLTRRTRRVWQPRTPPTTPPTSEKRWGEVQLKSISDSIVCQSVMQKYQRNLFSRSTCRHVKELLSFYYTIILYNIYYIKSFNILEWKMYIDHFPLFILHAFFIRKLVMLLVLDFLKNFSKF